MFGDERKPQTDSTKKAYPIDTVVEFKSKSKAFKAYVRSMKSSVEFKPTSFVIVDEVYKIDAFGYYSNFVKNLATDEFIVKDFNSGSTIYEGVYDREKVKSKDLVLKKVYIVYEGGDLVEYQFNGTSMFNVNQDIAKIDTNKYLVEYVGTKEAETKKGKVNVPEFKQGKEIDKDTFDKVMDAVEIWKEYLG